MLNGPRSRILAEGLRVAVLFLAIPAVLLAAAYILGSRLPKDHTATVSGNVEAPPTRVWELLTDIAAQSTWRQTPMVIIRGSYDPGTRQGCWTEGWVLIKFPLCATDNGPLHRVVQTSDPTYPFAATWTYDLAPQGAGTLLTITEESSIDRPFWRFLGHYILRNRTSNAFYLTRLQAAAKAQPMPPDDVFPQP